MELDHAIIRILAAIERERDYPAEEEEWQGARIRTEGLRFWRPTL